MKNNYTITNEIDTRDNSNITVIRITTHIENIKNLIDDFYKSKIYYSKYKKGFITKEQITKEQIENVLEKYIKK